jgi:hypothetical protein
MLSEIDRVTPRIRDDFEIEEEKLVSRAAIAEQNETLLRRQYQFRMAADFVVEAWRDRPEVEAVALFGSVAVPLWKEVPRFPHLRRKGIAVWHECKDVDIAVWLSRTDELNGLRKAKTRAMSRLFGEKGVGVASHQMDVFVIEPGSDRYLGRLCDFARCPNDKRECLVEGCGTVGHLKQHEGFVLGPDALADGRTIPLFDRKTNLVRRAVDVPVTGKEEDSDSGLA